MACDEPDQVSLDHGPSFGISSLILGGAVFSHFYNSDEDLRKNTPESTILFAFRNGINAIDTSPYYKGSEAIIGRVISKPEFRAEFPRKTYHILTKCGRYGASVKDFDYSPERIRRSIKESCTEMHTDYLDVVYLHDVEFVAECFHDSKGGENEGLALTQQSPHPQPIPIIENPGKSWGPGDDSVILAIKTLFQLKSEGVIRKVGISGYPLGTLLRISLLVPALLHVPLDIVMSYACSTLQNNSLSQYLPHFQAAGVNQIISASPFGMGLLTTRGPPDWHPAPIALRQLIQSLAPSVEESFESSLERISLFHSLKFPHTVIGVSSIEELKLALEVAEVLQNDKVDNRALLAQELVKRTLKSAGFLDWSWPSP